MYKKTIMAVLSAALVVLCLCACSGTGSNSATSSETNSAQDENLPIYLEIGNAMADVSDGSDGKAMLTLDFKVTNTSEGRSAEMQDLPRLTLNGTVVETTYEHQDSEKTVLAPDDVAYAHVETEYDINAEHEWRFKVAEGTVVSGLDEYVRIIEAQRNYEGKPQVTQEDIDKVEAEQEAAYQEFLKEEAQKESQAE